MESTYTVKTRVFEGPLDLLLELVTKRKLFVNDVSLAEVTDDFIRYIEDPELQQAEYGAGHLGVMAEFILIASTLMLIKSRSLLPMLQLTEDEEVAIHDLEDRLALYARIKELSAQLKPLFGRQIIFEKLAERISSASKFKFRESHGAKGKLTYEKKVSIIVGFLAMLELVKRGAIRVTQDSRGNIEMESEEMGVPTYI